MTKTQMSAEQAKRQLGEVLTAMSEQFPKLPDRVEQLRHHITTADMVVDHLFDEQSRADHDRDERVRRAQEGE